MEIIREGAKSFVADSNESVEFKLVRTTDDLEDDGVFKPEMSHQIFGDSENIFGYKDLKIKIYYSAAWLTSYIGIEYSDKIDPDDFGGVEPDNILKKLSVWYPPGFLTNVNSFIKTLDKEKNFVPYGDLQHTFTSVGEDNKERKYEIYHCDTSMKAFLSYHERLQTFLLWYIDGASYIDVDDEKWQFFILYEKYSTPDNKKMYSIAGYITVYEYYAYPLNIRPRISQVLILPPYQHQGLCTHLLNTIYNFYVDNKDVVDITVEDPTEEFQLVRDFVDICRCDSLDSYSPDKLHEGFNEKMAEEAKRSSKINKKQARRVYEILRLKATDMNDEKHYRNYRLNVKKRLNIPYQKEQAYMNKLRKLLNEQEYQTTLTLNGIGQRIEKLEKQYKELEEQYLHVLKRYEKRRHN
ncbi:histone acetyltransferase 1 [Lycorma delicatula]|uniref:histone acetyltransferase 1 n=1 Tax=Lycorma delicatula TaxID=130591 RepID=UPI003F516EB0